MKPTNFAAIFVIISFFSCTHLYSQSNRVKYDGSRSYSKRSNRVLFPGYKNSKNLNYSQGYQTKAGNAAFEREASKSDFQRIKSIVQKYIKGRNLRVKDAFRELSPTLIEFHELFNDELFAKEVYHKYFEEYEENFKETILKKVSFIEFDRMKAMEIKIGNILPIRLKNKVENLNTKLLKVDFFWPEDKFGIIGNNPLITLYFVEVHNRFKLFHFHVLENKNPKP